MANIVGVGATARIISVPVKRGKGEQSRTPRVLKPKGGGGYLVEKSNGLEIVLVLARGATPREEGKVTGTLSFPKAGCSRNSKKVPLPCQAPRRRAGPGDEILLCEGSKRAVKAGGGKLAMKVSLDQNKNSGQFKESGNISLPEKDGS